MCPLLRRFSGKRYNVSIFQVIKKGINDREANTIDPEKDLAPMPFGGKICRLALNLKKGGLNWWPHVGCFVWDPDRCIKAESPFPGRVYFVLSLPRFIEIFGSTANMVEKLVWLPTWHQARMLGRRLDMTDDDLTETWQFKGAFSPLKICIGFTGLSTRSSKNKKPHDDIWHNFFCAFSLNLSH
jgi:hypothetical protein